LDEKGKPHPRMLGPVAKPAVSVRAGLPRGRSWELVQRIASEFGEHRLTTYFAALAFQALVALVPITMLGLGTLAAAGEADVWEKSIAPEIDGRVTPPVFDAIDFSVERLLESSAGGLIAFSFVFALWSLTLLVRTVTEALNAIHDADDRRSFARRILTAAGLALAVGLCLVATVLVLAVAPDVSGSAPDALLSVARWLVAAVILALAVALLMRYAPAERPEKRWATAGSILVIGVWIVASLLFRVYVSTLADFKSPIGTLTAFLVLTGYLYTTAAIFLLGAELDELRRKEERRPN
jgi:membrane protein